MPPNNRIQFSLRLGIVPLVIVLFIVFSSSCTCWVKTMPFKRVIVNYQSCYNGQYTGLDSIIPTNGFYATVKYYPRKNEETGKNEMIPDTARMMFYRDGLFYNRGFWGNYRVKNDTIITYTFEPPCGMSWGGRMEKYLITQKKRLKKVYASSLHEEYWLDKAPEEWESTRKQRGDDRSEAFFVSSESLPKREECWLLKSNWFRCEE